MEAIVKSPIIKLFLFLGLSVMGCSLSADTEIMRRVGTPVPVHEIQSTVVRPIVYSDQGSTVVVQCPLSGDHFYGLIRSVSFSLLFPETDMAFVEYGPALYQNISLPTGNENQTIRFFNEN